MVRFLRQLAAVTALVAVVVLIGLAWHHFAPDSFGGQGGTGPHPGAGQATVEGWRELLHPSTATACI